MNKPKIGVLGLGHLGKIHLKLLLEQSHAICSGVFDTNHARCEAIRDRFNVHVFDSEEDLIKASDAIILVTPTPSHYSLAKQCLLHSKHVFIEKPLCSNLEEALELKKLSDINKCIVQIGHVERFNPAFQAAQAQPIDPMFIECHRLAPFNPRGTDVSVVMDLMIHDLDLILSLVNSKVEKIDATGISIVSAAPDIANVRLTFSNGCVVNCTASRVSMKAMRKMRVFQNQNYLSMDFMEKSTERIQLHNTSPVDSKSTPIEIEGHQSKKYLEYEKSEPSNNNAIMEEQANFIDAMITGASVRVPIEDGIRCLDLALQIDECIQEYQKHYQ